MHLATITCCYLCVLNSKASILHSNDQYCLLHIIYQQCSVCTRDIILFVFFFFVSFMRNVCECLSVRLSSVCLYICMLLILKRQVIQQIRWTTTATMIPNRNRYRTDDIILRNIGVGHRKITCCVYPFPYCMQI